MRDRLARTLEDLSERATGTQPPAPMAPLGVRVARAVRGILRMWVALLAIGVVVTVFYSIDAEGPVAYAWLAGQVFTLTITVALAIAVGFAAVGDRLPAAGRASMLARGVVIGGGIAVGTEVGLRLLSLLPFYPPASVLRAGVLPAALMLGATAVSGLWLVGALRTRSQQVLLRERDALRARLQALQARTEPHFLFNSLNALAGLIEEDPKRAVEAVERLAELFRHSLERSQRTTVPLSDEVDATRSFLELEALRHGERLRFRLDLDPRVADAPVPPLCLQPLVENAVRHGIAGRDGGSVEVTAGPFDGAIRLRVSDDGPGPGHSAHRAGTGTALADLRSRLLLLYGERARLSLEPRHPTGSVVTLDLPREHVPSIAPVETP